MPGLKFRVITSPTAELVCRRSRNCTPAGLPGGALATGFELKKARWTVPLFFAVLDRLISTVPASPVTGSTRVIVAWWPGSTVVRWKADTFFEDGRTTTTKEVLADNVPSSTLIFTVKSPSV